MNDVETFYFYAPFYKLTRWISPKYTMFKRSFTTERKQAKSSSTQSQLLAIETNICLPTASKPSETSVNTDVVFLTSRKLT